MASRRQRGAAAPNASLTEAQVAYARLRFQAGGVTVATLARALGCNYKALWRAVNYHTYCDEPEGLTNACQNEDKREG